jgi:hypothetical protein
VRKIACNYPGDEITSNIVLRLGRDGENDAFAREENLEIQNPPMVDVRVGPTQTPVVRKRLEMGPHFFVDILLEIDTEFTIGPYDEIRAHANAARDVTVGVRDGAIASVIDDAVIRAFHCGTNEALAEAFGLAIAVGNRRGGQNHD